MITLYHPELDLSSDTCFDLPDSERKHLRAFRVGVGEPLRLVDGCGNAVSGTLTRFDKTNCDISGLVSAPANEPLTERIIVLAQIDPPRLEEAVEALVPLGMTKLVVAHTQHSQLHPSFRLARLRSTAIAAMKQCHRAALPVIDCKEEGKGWELSEILSHPISANKFFADFTGEHITPSLLGSIDAKLPLQIAIGPEGGFSDPERELLRKSGFLPVSFGKRTLRAGLAAVTALAKLTVD